MHEPRRVGPTREDFRDTRSKYLHCVCMLYYLDTKSFLHVIVLLPSTT
jgi:hypothetical protein